MRVSVFGLGYVGCVTSACLARAGHTVTGVDVNADTVALINRGASPIVEPGLDTVLAEVTADHRLCATMSADEAVDGSDLALVCVGTPGRANGQLDTSALERAGREIGEALRSRRDPFTLVLRSTVLPGTTEGVLERAVTEGAGRERGDVLRVAMNPEFIRDGSALDDFVRPPFTLVGCAADDTAAAIASLYAGVQAPFVRTTIRTAEMVKYAANAFHALKISFANEIGELTAALG